MYSTPTRIDLVEVQSPDENYALLPFDDVSLAFSLGIKARTLWWLVVKNNLKNQLAGRGMYREFKIPKGRGKFRTIHEPALALKNVQKAILVTYLDPIGVAPCVGAYVPGRSMLWSVKRHAGAKVKLSLDIRDFFGSTRRAWVREEFRHRGFSHECAKILGSLTTIPRPVWRGDGVDPGVRSVLPQGAPTSGSIANLVGMRRIDWFVEDVLHGVFGDWTSWTYTRYSDNLEISLFKSVTRQTADDLLVLMRGIITQAGYRVREDKTDVQRATSPTRSMRMLGFTVNEHPNVPKGEYRRLRAMVFNLTHKDPETQFKRYGAKSLGEMLTSLRGRLIYWRQVAPWKIQPLIDVLDSSPTTSEPG